MRYIQKIISYFTARDFPDEMTRRVQRRLLDGEHDPDTQEALGEHWAQVESMPFSAARNGAAYAVLCAKLDLPSRQNKPKMHMLKRLLRLTAIWFVPVLLAGSTFFFFRKYTDLSRQLVANSFQEEYVPAGKRQQFTLPDGSKAWVNAGSFLVYPKLFLGNNREVLLVGEAFFSVAKDEERPFMVKTSQLMIKVTGTEFNVSAYPDNEDITTTLEHGSIEVIIPGRDEHILLQPNQQLIYNKKEAVARLVKVNAIDYSDWKSGGLLFKDTSLKEIVSTLERVYNVKIQIKDSSLLDDKLTIHFNQNESLDTVLMLLKEMIPTLEYRINGDEILIF